MALSIEEILLQVRSDGDQARADLAETQAELNGFDHQEATAELTIKGEKARAEVNDLKGRLADFARQTADATAGIDTAKGSADLTELERRLNAIDGENVSPDVEVRIAKALIDVQTLKLALDSIPNDKEVDIKTRKDLVSRIGGITRGVESLTGALGGGGGGGGAITALESLGGAASSVAQPALIALAAVIVTVLVAALTALVASAVAAGAAVGALAIAFGATLLPAIGLVIGAIQRFKAQSGIAGTAANQLKQSFEGFGKAVKGALGPGVDALFRGLSGGLKAIIPLVRSLREPFRLFGATAGAALKTIGTEFAKPVWRNFFAFLIDAARKITPLLTKAFIDFARILRNIAQAAMPFLIKGMRAFVNLLDDLAKGTSNTDKLRGAIGFLVGNLKVWLQLAGDLGRVFLGFLRATAPIGEKFVKFLDQGAQSLADWANSAEGRKQIRQFFADTMPLVRELVKMLAQLIPIWLQIVQAAAPTLTTIAQGINFALGVVRQLINGVASLGTAFKVAAAIIFGPFLAAFAGLSVLPGVVKGVMAGVSGAISGARKGIADVARSIAHAVVAAFRAVIGAASAAGHAVMSGVRSGIAAVRGAVVGVARSIARAVVDAVKAVVGAASAAGHAVMNAVRGGIAGVRGAVVGVARDILQAVIGAVRAVVGAAGNAGSAVGNAIGNGLTSAVKAAIGVVKGAINAVINAWNSISFRVPSIDPPGPGPTFGGETIGVPHVNPLARGIRNFVGGLALVGEQGPELANVPAGADVFNHRATTAILESLAKGQGGGEQHITVVSPAGTLADPEIVGAKLGLRLRQEGRR